LVVVIQNGDNIPDGFVRWLADETERVCGSLSR
jgi:hypothetical protein